MMMSHWWERMPFHSINPWQTLAIPGRIERKKSRITLSAINPRERLCSFMKVWACSKEQTNSFAFNKSTASRRLWTDSQWGNTLFPGWEHLIPKVGINWCLFIRWHQTGNRFFYRIIEKCPHLSHHPSEPPVNKGDSGFSSLPCSSPFVQRSFQRFREKWVF